VNWSDNLRNNVFQQARENLATALEFNEMLRKRIGVVCVSSTALVGIISAAKFLPESTTGYNVESILLGLVCLASVAIYWFAAKAYSPSIAPLPGPDSYERWYEGYLVKGDEGLAYSKMLSDYSYVTQTLLSQNKHFGWCLRGAISAFIAQLFVLSLAVAWSGLAAWLGQ